MKTYLLYFFFLATLILSQNVLHAQLQSPLNIALQEAEQNYSEWGFEKSDINDMYVNDLTFDKSTGISRVYFQQRHAGIKVFGAILNISMEENGEVFFVAKRFIPALQSKVNSTLPQIKAVEAVAQSLQALSIPTADLQVKSQEGVRSYIFQNEEVFRDDVKVDLRYFQKEEEVKLAWMVQLQPKDQQATYRLFTDAITGEILYQKDEIIHCAFQNNPYHRHETNCKHEARELGTVAEALSLQNEANSMLLTDNAQYKVFPIPIESPAHGMPSLVQNPAYAPASPYGWHDTNGAAGAEYTFTRGNNTWTWADRDNNQEPDAQEAQGGTDLIFDFPFDPNSEPEDFVPFATTNLFYMVNIMHDYAYAMGMDEEAGNFQNNNYGNGGAANDEIYALAQAGANTGSVNDAYFSPTVDGERSYIGMYIWDETSGAKYLTVNEPANVAGTYSTGITLNWGQTVTDTPVSGEVVIANDNVFNASATDACETLVNGSDVNNKIALVDRGSCDFSTKALNAQNQGAIGVIICNFEDDIINMNPGQDGSAVNIPVVFIQSTDCATIRQFAGEGLEVALVLPDFDGTTKLDGDLDNGIIAHEYAHGISTRLTCGPSGAGLLNGEQAGEGWSDFMALAMTVRDNDTGDMPRGVGTYVLRDPNDGRGIRRYPYSTDMTLNPLTYANVGTNTEVHAVGEVFCSTLWDMFWAFIDEYGYDASVTNTTSGNNRAMRLIFDGMKNQACSPGFLDARDAILAADEALYNGDHQCLIWEVFARRGMGVNANQGSPFSASDQMADFTPLPSCVPTIKIEKEVSSLINAGDDIEVTLTIRNDKTTDVTGLVVTDEVPAGASYILGSSTIEGMVNGNAVSFPLGTLAAGEMTTFTYRYATSEDVFSVRKFYDDIEGDLDAYAFNTFDEEDITNNWQWTTSNANSGLRSFFVLNIGVESQDALFRIEPILIDGDNPVIRFYHNYDTQAGVDAGLFEVTTADDPITGLWENVGDRLFRGEYPLPVDYQTFVVPNLDAFSGDSDGWIASYVDMSDYAGQEVYLRWRFGTNNNTAGGGWYVDDIEFMNMENYVSEACISSAEGDSACATPEGQGTIVESKIINSTYTPVGENLNVAVYPNPAKDFVHIQFQATQSTSVDIELYSMTGQILQRQGAQVAGEQDIILPLSNVAAGVYFVKVNAGGLVFTEKLVVK